MLKYVWRTMSLLAVSAECLCYGFTANINISCSIVFGRQNLSPGILGISKGKDGKK